MIKVKDFVEIYKKELILAYKETNIDQFLAEYFNIFDFDNITKMLVANKNNDKYLNILGASHGFYRQQTEDSSGFWFGYDVARDAPFNTAPFISDYGRDYRLMSNTEYYIYLTIIFNFKIVYDFSNKKALQAIKAIFNAAIPPVLMLKGDSGFIFKFFGELNGSIEPSATIDLGFFIEPKKSRVVISTNYQEKIADILGILKRFDFFAGYIKFYHAGNNNYLSILADISANFESKLQFLF